MGGPLLCACIFLHHDGLLHKRIWVLFKAVLVIKSSAAGIVSGSLRLVVGVALADVVRGAKQCASPGQPSECFHMPLPLSSPTYPHPHPHGYILD